MTEPMTSEQREQIRKAMQILAKRGRTMTDAARAQRSNAAKSMWRKKKQAAKAVT